MGADARVLPQAPEPELSGPRRLARQAVESAPLLAAGALLLHAGADLLPEDPLFSKITLARLLIAGGLVALIATGARWRDFRTGLDAPVIVLLLAGAATTYRQDTYAALRFLVTALGLFYLTVGLCRRSSGSREALPVLALVAVVVAAAAGVAQVVQDDPTGFYRDGVRPVASDAPREDLLVRARGTFSNPTLLAGLALLLAPIGLAAAARRADLDVRVALAGLAAVAYLGLAVTFSRAAAAAALVGLGVAAFALRPGWRLALGAAAGGMAGAVLIANLASGGDLLLGFGQGDAWRSAVERWVDGPVTGIGLGRVGDGARNLWLTWLVEAGPLALLALLWITGWLLVAAWRGAAAGSLGSAAGLAALTGFFVYSLVQDPAASERVAAAFWIVAALVAAGAPRPRAGALRRLLRRVAPAAGAAVRALLAAMAVIALAGTGCGGDDEPDGRAASTPSPPAPAPGNATRPEGGGGGAEPAPEGGSAPGGGGAPPSDGGSEPGDGGAPSEGGEEEVRTEVTLRAGGGRVSPRRVAVAPFVAVSLRLRSTDGRAQAARVGGRTLTAPAGRSGRPVMLRGLGAGERYTIRLSGGGTATIVASAEPGP